MSVALNWLGLATVYAANIWFAAFAAVLAVGSDGSASGIWFVGIAFGIVNAVSIVCALLFMAKQRYGFAWAVAMGTSPAAFVITFTVGLTLAIMREAT
jgi:hypothetical protein